MIRRYLSVFVAMLSVTMPVSADERGSSEPSHPLDTIKIEVRGTLNAGVMAIGAETTGTTITAKNIHFNIDWRGNGELARRATQLGGRHVRVKGELRQQIGPERGPRLVIDAESLGVLSVNKRRSNNPVLQKRRDTDVIAQ